MAQKVKKIKKVTNPSDESLLDTLIFSIDREIADTKQIEDDFVGMYELENGVVEPPYNPILWASLMEKNTRLSKLIRTYAQNTVGRGYKISPIVPFTKDTTEEEKREINRQIEIVNSVFKKPNKRMPFSTIMKLCKIDEEATGNGYLEVARNEANKIKGLYHVPSHTVRVRKGGLGFVQIRNGKKVYFKPIGADFDIDIETGDKYPLNSLPYKRRANEMIQFLIYSPRSSYYGVPRYTGTAIAIAGNQLAGRRNLAFFKNDATPRLVISVSNGQLTPDSVAEIKSFVESLGKGAENAHRVMVIQAKSKMLGPDAQANTKIEVTPLTVGITDDGSFLKYRQANDEELRESFGIDSIFLGSGLTANRATAQIARNITNEQEFLPDIEEKEYMINSYIVEAILADEGIKPEDIKIKFEFIRPKSTDDVQDAEIFVRYLQGGGITPNDIRHKLGLPEFKEKWADKPIQIALIEYQMGLYGVGQNTESAGEDPQNQARNEDTTNEGSKLPEIDDNSTKDEKSKLIKMITKEVMKQINVQNFINKIYSTTNIDAFNTVLEKENIS
ncbi:phage portal protein [Thermosipho sp. (in: thermotogales)]|uniref:phage portal protein n=1 Tax=Thermosipho sp. (in: thermotogales) TaxID=1968895 RepID=UPI00257D4785|nr:phage portal protein [Thermosipho sp. (in: thermotogales)]MBZ4649192.1 phage portal protein [Thermosipho sp. (in: thermotogales)]